MTGVRYDKRNYKKTRIYMGLGKGKPTSLIYFGYPYLMRIGNPCPSEIFPKPQ